MVTTCWSCWSATDFGGLLSVIMEPPGSPSWMSSPPDQPLPNSPPLAPLAISGPQQRLGRRIGGGLGAGTRARTHVQVLCKLAMERRRLIVEGVMPPTVCGNQCRDGRRHLVFGRRQHAGLVALRREVADPRCWRLVSLWWPGRVVAHSGPGGVAAGRARTLRPGRAMSGAGKLDAPGMRGARTPWTAPSAVLALGGYRAGVSLVIHVIHSALGYRAPVG